MSWQLNPNFKEDTDFHADKKEFAAAVISNCGATSRRLEYIKQMQNYVKVDVSIVNLKKIKNIKIYLHQNEFQVFGKCGRQCPTVSQYDSRITGDCKEIIGTDYKFYLAFENSVCTDYITEKFFGILAFNIIPVVLGGGQYDYYVSDQNYFNMKLKYLQHI